MRYRLRTLLIVLAFAPPLLAVLAPVVAQYFHEPDAPEAEMSDEIALRGIIGTDLAYYAYRNDVAKLREELAKGADINEKPNMDGWTALVWAIQGNSHEAVQVLLEHDPARLKDIWGFSPSYYAEDDRMRELLKIPATDEQTAVTSDQKE